MSSGNTQSCSQQQSWQHGNSTTAEVHRGQYTSPSLTQSTKPTVSSKRLTSVGLRIAKRPHSESVLLRFHAFKRSDDLAQQLHCEPVEPVLHDVPLHNVRALSIRTVARSAQKQLRSCTCPWRFDTVKRDVTLLHRSKTTIRQPHVSPERTKSTGGRRLVRSIVSLREEGLTRAPNGSSSSMRVGYSSSSMVRFLKSIRTTENSVRKSMPMNPSTRVPICRDTSVRSITHTRRFSQERCSGDSLTSRTMQAPSAPALPCRA